MMTSREFGALMCEIIVALQFLRNVGTQIVWLGICVLSGFFSFKENG